MSETGKRVAVFGPMGMLGREMMECLTTRGYEAIPIYRRMYELASHMTVRRILDSYAPDAVVNCTGVLPNSQVSTAEMVVVNSLFPHVLNMAVGGQIPLVLVSTDCVFNGRSNFRYSVDSPTDATDYYGKSKALGEVAGLPIVVRTSFIGCDHGFLRWVLDAKGSIQGWKGCLWTGSTVDKVANGVIDLMFSGRGGGLVHLATKNSISKYDLALKIVKEYNLDLQVVASNHPFKNRSLMPTVELPPIEVSLSEFRCSRGGVVDIREIGLRETDIGISDPELSVATGS